VKGKTLLITGGTGTFGNAVLGRYLKTDIAEIRIFSRDEKKQDDMRRHWADPRVKFHIGDVRHEQSLADAMAGANYVFHAAALKQVPSCEFFPMEAVRTNTIGTENMLNAAIAAGAERVIVLSTDKAVYPINAMGISKAMMEKLAVAKSRVAGTRTVICGTRYGNVMASRGSVVPLFIRQIQAGQPLTVTDPLMTRFMMSIDGAVDLVQWAFDHGNPGDVFVQKAPPRRRLRPESSGRDDPYAGAGGVAGLQGGQSDSGDRHAARREAVRDAAHPRGTRDCRRHG
jgi:UDP-glucose 4-epimerase